MDTPGSNREPMTTSVSGQVAGVAAATLDSPNGEYGACATTAASVMSPRRILTAASSSGSDPLASPSNEVISDSDCQLEQSVLLTGMPGMAGSMLPNQHGIPAAANHPSVQARLFMLEKQFHLQKELLSRQFEEQCRLLDHEQQAKMQEYLKQLMVKQQQEEVYEMQKRLAEEQKNKDKWEQIKNKRKKKKVPTATLR